MATKRARVGAKDLGIDLEGQKDAELFKWLVACLLFAKPVQQEIAAAAFSELDRERLTRAATIKKAGWQHLVHVLGQAHYVRYDESTATRLIQAADTLEERYGGSMRHLLRDS